MCELCDSDSVTVVIAGEPPADEPDNAAMIARDLSDLRSRWMQMRFDEVGGRTAWAHVNSVFVILEHMLETK